MLREWFKTNEHADATLPQFLVVRILADLEPVKPSPPLPLGEPEDIKLLCWLGIESVGKRSVER